MTNVSRRQLVQAAGVLAAAWALPIEVVGRALAETPVPSSLALSHLAPSQTTLDRTIRVASKVGKYRKLGYAAGEPFILRQDLGATANSGRGQSCRSLLYFGQYSDTHIKDTQNPAVPHPGEELWLLGSGDLYRPQETMTTHVLNEMIRAINNVPSSPVTGAPLAFSVVTGDLTDQCSHDELRWVIDNFDGKTIVPNTGDPSRFEGMEVFDSVKYAWHPGFNSTGYDVYAEFDFPRYSNLIDSVIAPFQAVGSSVPWYSVFGNHDMNWSGFLPHQWIRDMLGASRRKPTEIGEFATIGLLGGGTNNAAKTWQDIISKWWNAPGYRYGTAEVTPDATNRRTFNHIEFMTEMFNTAPNPGPVGHGFSQSNLSSGNTYWQQQAGPVAFIGLDTCNHTTGSEGSLHAVQFDWLQQQLMANSRRYFDANGVEQTNNSGTDRLIVLFSHHNSFTMDNASFDATFPYPRVMGDALINLLQRFPNVVAWVNGHSHINKVLAHKNPWVKGVGFWEVNSASCVDFPQQNRVVEIVDNRDGTLSLFTLVMDHAGPPAPTGTFSDTTDIAALSRELAVNDPYRFGLYGAAGILHNPTKDQFFAAGKPEDRNVELIVNAPFNLGTISDELLGSLALRSCARHLAKSKAALQNG